FVMDAAAGLGHGPLESPAEALLYFFNQVLPAWKPIFARQHQLGITLRQRQFGFGQMGTTAPSSTGSWSAIPLNPACSRGPMRRTERRHEIPDRGLRLPDG